MNEAAIDLRIESAYRRHLDPEATVDAVRRLTGGASASTTIVDATVRGAPHRSILRRSASRDGFVLNIEKSVEARVQQEAHTRGVPAARVLFVLDDEDALGPGYAMDFVVGETQPAVILRDAALRATLAGTVGGVLARLHAVPVDVLPSLPYATPAEQLRGLRDSYDSYAQPSPVFEVAFRHLEARPPTSRAKALVHGDFRTGNLLVGSEGIRAVLDWELCHVGDPIEDLGWLAVASWRFGRLGDRVGGFGSVDALRRAYVDAGGVAFDDADLAYWEMYGTLRWGVICLYQAFAHLRGEIPSIERAAIGRRVSEVELDLVELLEGA